MGIYRSEKMLLCQILLSQETVFDCIEVLGNIGLVEFRDLNASVTQYQRRYVTDIRRCEEMERKLRLLETEIKKSSTVPNECKEIPSAPGAKETLLLESNLESLVGEIRNVNKSMVILKRNLVEFVEQHHVLKKASAWLQNNQLVFDDEKQEGLSDTDQEKIKDKGVGHLKITTGVILVEKIKAFELLVWRICRGVAFIKIIHISDLLTDPDTGILKWSGDTFEGTINTKEKCLRYGRPEQIDLCIYHRRPSETKACICRSNKNVKVKKAVFIVICQGDSLNEKILKTCNAFHCHLYVCPASDERRKELENEAVTGIKETEQVLQKTQDHRKRVLQVAAMNADKWKLQVLKLKSIFHVMNMLQLDEINEFQSAECWLPQNDIHFIREKLNMAAERFNSQNNPIIIVMKHNEKPPTYNRTNKFTRGFQAVIDAYGVSNYREMNPMPFTIITFPFLFGVMFGDVGHGLILTLFAIFMIFYEDKLRRKRLVGEIQKIFFEGRYIILLMGLFSCYTGLIYNDFFSKSLNLFGSSWKIKYNLSTTQKNKDLQLDPERDFTGQSYVFGVDPVWQASENKIVFLNSLKMKMSVIFGIFHMFFGILLSLGNHVYFKQSFNVYTELLPQVIYFGCLFLYLVYLIFVKWIMYGPSKSPSRGPSCAPSILLTFINMMMFKKTPAIEGCPQVYPNQQSIQKILVTMALICIPWIFTAKTTVLLQRRKSQMPKDSESDDSKAVEPKSGRTSTLEEEREEIKAAGEIIINHGVRTIEFVLGSISHTASYLRLWALSLAHAQLSDVLWKMVFCPGIGSRSTFPGFAISLTFAVWAILTIAILILMEGLSAFLHTLRLHWVEFQSKFYSGAGYPFKPYSFEKIFEQQEIVDDSDKSE